MLTTMQLTLKYRKRRLADLVPNNGTNAGLEFPIICNLQWIVLMTVKLWRNLAWNQ